MFKVGITGGIGSGKSTVCRLFAARGIAVYDSDSEAKRLMNSSEELRARIEARFGTDAYRPIWIGWCTRPCVPTSPPGPNGSSRSM